MTDFLKLQSDIQRRTQRKIWDTPSFLEEFCSHISAPVNDIGGSTVFFASACEYLCECIASGSIDAAIGAQAEPTIRMLCASMGSRIPFYRKLASFEQWGSDYHYSRMVGEVSFMIASLTPGSFLLVPAQAPSGPIVLLVEAEDERMCRVVVINPSPYAMLHRKTVLTSGDTANGIPRCDGNAKILQNIAMPLCSARRSRIASEAFWLLVLGKVSTTDELFYQHLLCWMTERDFEGQTAEGLSSVVPATPSKAPQGAGGYWKPLVHTLRYLLHTRANMNKLEVKHVRFFLRKFFIRKMEGELLDATKITLTQKKLMEAALGTLALAAARVSATCSIGVLDAVRSDVERITQLIGNLPVKGESASAQDEQPLLDVTSGWDRAQQPDVFPLFDMFRRLDSVEEFVGVKEEQAKATPINFFRFRERLETIDEITVALADAVQLMVRVSAHADNNAVKNAHFLVFAAVAHLVVEVLPMPLGPLTKLKTGHKTLWDTPVSYAQQVHLLTKLHEVGLFFHWAYKSADQHRDADAVHMLVPAALAAIADNVIRTPATDLPSVVTEHLNGTHALQSGGGFSVSAGALMSQTEVATFTYPEALLTRAAVLDYFDELVRHHPTPNVVLKMEEENSAAAKEHAMSKMLKQIALAESFTPHAFPDTLDFAVEEDNGPHSFICRFYPEFRLWRNIVGLAKVATSSSGGKQNAARMLAELPASDGFNTSQGRLMYCINSDNTASVRFPSDAEVSGYIDIGKDKNITEDDILHIQSLPSFGILGQRDVELLLSFLTTPYLRIPLILRFFATEDRVSSLMDESLCVLLHGVLFEPGRFLPISLADDCPVEVPSEQPHLIATPNGLLINELQCSPRGVVEPLLKLLRLVKEMDAGTVFNEAITRIVLILTRVVAHVEGYLALVLHTTKNRTGVHREERSFVILEEEQEYLISAHRQVRTVVTDELLPMLDSWIDELNIAIDKNELCNLDPSTASSMLSGLHLHVLLLLRNVQPSEYNTDFVSRMLSSFAFLTTRFVWGRHVHFNEHEAYLVLQKHRRSIAEWLYVRTADELGIVMNSVVRVATGSGLRVDTESVNYPWGFVAGRECTGRFMRADAECLSRKGSSEGKEALVEDIRKTLPGVLPTAICQSTPTIQSGMHEVEVSIHSGCLTFKAAFLKSIPPDIANDSDVRELFEQQLRKTRVNPEAMQCAIVEEATNRIWIQLVGLEHDIQYWRTNDPRVPIPSDSMRFYPDDCEFTEKWIAPVFELYRRAFFQRSFFQPPILILLPEEKLTDDASVAMLTAVCSATGEKLKEIYVFRDYQSVHIFDIVSHGRRFYRQHVFYSDVDSSFKEDSDAGGHGDGTADRSIGSTTSAVILRRPTHPKNLSRSVETYIPARFLRGLLPDALITHHTFWQDEDDNIRGYPDDRKSTHLLWLHWKDLRYAPMGGTSIGVQVFRFAVAAAAPRASEQAVLKSQRIELSEECDDEIVMSRATRTNSSEEVPQQEAGMYRQSSVVHVAKPDSATIEDHNLLLLNLLFARAGTPLHSLAQVLMRLEPLGEILVWTAQTDYDTMAGGPASLDLIHLPLLKLSFRAKLIPETATYAIYSLDHAHLCISNARPGSVMGMTRGIPHSLIMSDPNDTLTLLVPRFCVARRDARSPFSVDVVVQRYSQPDWYDRSDSTKYYLYPVHISQMFLFTPSYASAVYLLLLRYLNRNYAETYRLVASVGTDEAVDYDVSVNLDAVMAVRDQHPDAIACMARMTLYVGRVPWDIAELVARHVSLQSRTSVSCLMPAEEELRLVELAWQGEERLRIMRTVVKQNSAMMEAHRNRRSSRGSLEIRLLAQKAMREELGSQLADHKVASLFEKAMSDPLNPYSKCLVLNRRLLLQAEQELLLDAGKKSKMVSFEVPKMPEDQRLMFFREYDPTSITIEAHRWMNDQKKPVTCSPNDYYLCNVTKREYKCRCGYSCRDTCGGGSKDGCPCLSCERFNKENRNTIRLLPPSLDNKNASRPMPFMEIHSFVRQAYSAHSARLKRQASLVEPCNFHSEQISLRNALQGFFMLYELCLGSRLCKIGKRSIGRELVQLMLPLYHDGVEVASALCHMIQYISKLDKERLLQLPHFTKKVKVVHLAEVHEALIGIIAETDAEGKPHPQPPDLATMPKYTHEEDRRNDGLRSVVFEPRRLTRDASVPLAQTRILPTPMNCECSEQNVALPSLAHLQLRGEEHNVLTLRSSELEDLTGWPLRSFLDTPNSPLVFRVRAQLNLETISSELPFDLSVHPDATMSVAREMLERLTHEMSSFAKRSNEAMIPKVAGLESEGDVRRLLRAALGIETTPSLEAAVKGVLVVLDALKENLLQMRKLDNTYVAYANEVVLRTANFYSHQTLEGLVLTLRSIANREPNLKMEYLLSALCSTVCTDEWLQLNPFLTAPECVAMKYTIVISVLRANRAGHINRVLEVLRELQSFFHRASSLAGTEAAVAHLDAFVASVSQKSDALAALLAVKKCYFKAAPLQSNAAPKDGFLYDPRHLLFEFTWNLVMRKRQHELIGDMYGSVTRGESVVKQMIMGAGKTTVVSPVLGLMLANGRQLMVQVVPPALLDFTRAVLRTTFSSILQKQIFTFLCDRNTTVDSDIHAKFQEAIHSRGIVLTTPSSIKSLFLKCVESCRRTIQPALPLADRRRLVRDTRDHLEILGMWKDAVLVMDEVDLLLHPLKSELNFPIGAKKELDFQPIRWKLPIHLVDIIFSYHTGRLSTYLRDAPEAAGIVAKFHDAVARGLKLNVLQEMPHLILLNAPFYEAELKPVLVEWLLLFVKGLHLVGLSDDDTRNYLYRRPTTAREPDVVARVEALDPYHVKVLNLSFEWINSFLPHILQKIDRVTFGIMTQKEYYQNEGMGQSRSRLVTAIPFVGKDMPSPSSEFAHPDIVIGLTVLAYRYEGLRETDFHLIMQEVFAAVEREVGRYSQRRTTILYNKWVAAAGGSLLTTFDYQATRAKFNDDLDMGLQPSESLCLMSDDSKHRGMQLNYGGDMTRADSLALAPDQRNVLPLKLMKQANELEMKKLFKLFRRAPEVIHWYLTEHIFPEHMRHQEVKLSASGQELGGEMLFQRRIGFSGTPSSLLPIELGQCGYEVGTDGQLIHTLTSPNIMDHSVMASGWNVRTLLDVVAFANPPFHALIDTGALITGMSNLQVAEYLLKTGLAKMEGVVFLDEDDRKMILVRATGRSLPLSECGIPKVKRFAFYDQIHTTGMDIEHTPNAQAAQTLGKDMTFRDFSQGAYRMRGIGQGQTIHLVIIPEVADLVHGVMKAVRGFSGSSMHHATPHQVLVGVTAWLMVNSIRSEHIQHNQLRVQCCSNVWRKQAFRAAVDALESYQPTQTDADGGADSADVPNALTAAVGVFDEALDYRVISHVPQPRLFSEMLVEHVQGHDDYVVGAGKDVIAAIIDSSRREDEMDAPVIDVEMVQEQEEEREREEQKEQEQEIEIEKFVDHDYSREHESSMPWKLDTLRTLSSGLRQFYPLKDFHLFKRNPLRFPDHILLSRNYYSTKWTGYRRIKNVVVTLEWIPDCELLKKREAPSLDYGDLSPAEALVSVRRTLCMLLRHQSNESREVHEGTIKAFILTALQFADAQDSSEWATLLNTLRPLLSLDKDELHAAVLSILSSNALRHEEDGRHTVAVTLAEAETLRRVLHFRKARKMPIIAGAQTEFALHIVPGGNALLDKSYAFIDAASPYQRLKHFQCLRYFDGDLQYTDAEVGLLLRALHVNSQGARKLFFHQTISCRRRARQRWDRAPIATVFLLESALVLLHQRTVGLCMLKDIVERHDLALSDAFLAFNSSGSGVLSAEELWGAVRFCRLDLNAQDVLDFIDIADAQREGTIQYPDFLYMLSGTRDTDDDAEEQQAKNLPNVAPYGTEEISAAQQERSLRLRMEEEVSSQALADEERRVMEEIEQENIRVEMDTLKTFTNPLLEAKQLTFDLGTEKQVVQLVTTASNIVARQREEKCPGQVAACMLCCDSAVRCSLRGLLNILQPDEMNVALKAVNTFTITAEFCIPKAASFDSNRRDTYVLGAGIRMELAQWQLPYSCFASSSSKPPIEVTIAQQIEQRRIERNEAPPAEPKNSLQTPVAMIFSTCVPSLESFAGYLTAEATRYVVMASAKRQTVIIHELAYEYGLLDDARFPKGWVCCRFGAEQLVHPLHAVVQLLQDRLTLLVSTGELPGPPYGRIQSTDCDPERNLRGSRYGRFYGDEDDEEQEEEEEPEIEEADGEGDVISTERGKSRVYGDLEDLMFAIRRLRQLERGDRVRRHPKYWQHEDEDGGEGSIGKVVSVQMDEVEVLWPNQNRTTCHWGKAGIFELVKVPKDHHAQPDRKPDNDERHREFFISDSHSKSKGPRHPCAGCNERFILVDLLVCNECPKPVYLCEPCFLDGQHEIHDFTSFKFFTETEVKVKEGDEEGEEDEAGKDPVRADSNELAELGPLFDFGDDAAVAPSARDAPAPKTKENKPKEERPKDPNVVVDVVHDAVPMSDRSFKIGGWVRSLDRMPPAVRRHQLGFIVGHPNDVNLSVMFLSEYVGDANLHMKSVARTAVVPVRPYKDPTYGASIIEPSVAVEHIAQSRFSAGLWLLSEAGRSRARFEVGCAVKADPADGDPFFGVVGAVLPKGRFMIFPLSGTQRYIMKSSALERSFHKGENVRYRRSVTYPAFGWPSVPIGQRYTAQFRVSAMNLRGSRLSLSIEGAGTKCDADGVDLEPAEESTWIIYRNDGRADLLPNSCRIIIDRSHNEGKRFVRFTFGKRLFRVDFPSNQLVVESADGMAGDVQGVLARFPPLMWSRPPRVLALDDGAWHVVSVLFKGNSISALCDGALVPLDIEGHFEELCRTQRCKTDKSIAQMQSGAAQGKAQKNAKKKSKKVEDEDDWAFGLFGDDDDDLPPSSKKPVAKREPSITLLEASDEESEDEPSGEAPAPTEAAQDAQGTPIGELLSLHLTKPIVFFAADEDSGRHNFKLLTAPQRFVTRLVIGWQADLDEARAFHADAMLNGTWSCADCGRSNLRTHLTCDECNVPRRVHRVNHLLSARPQRRFRYATLRSSEASNLRQKLSNKLRVLFQAQLDDIQSAMAGEGDKQQEDLSDTL